MGFESFPKLEKQAVLRPEPGAVVEKPQEQVEQEVLERSPAEDAEFGRRAREAQDVMLREEAERIMEPAWYLLNRMRDGQEQMLDMTPDSFRTVEQYLPESGVTFHKFGRGSPPDARNPDSVRFSLTHDSDGYLELRGDKVFARRSVVERTAEM